MERKYIHDAYPSDITPIIRLFYDFSQLKNLYRQGWLHNGVPEAECESVADHSFGVALLGYVLAKEYRPDLDADLVMRLGLFHEIGEIHAGDLTPRDSVSTGEKSDREFAGVKQVFSHMKVPQQYVDIWRQYENQVTLESVFVHQVDKLEMALQASLYERLGNTGLDEFFPYVKERLASPELKSVLDDVLAARK